MQNITKIFLIILISGNALAMEAPQTDLHIAARSGTIEEVKALAFSFPQGKDAQDSFGNTPLHEATQNGKIEAVAFLLEFRVDVNRSNKKGETPLDLARNANQMELAGVLEAYGARSNQKVAAKPKYKVAPSLFEKHDLLFLKGVTGKDLSIPGVYHVYSRARIASQQGWACAFHALDNMRLLEGLNSNKLISDEAFIRAAQKHAKRPHVSSDNVEETKIAKEMGLKHMVTLADSKNGKSTEILFDTSTKFSYYNGEDPDTVGELAVQIRQEEEWQRLRRVFEDSKEPICIHFCAGIMAYTHDSPHKGEPHGITVSVTKNVDGEVAIYIFDNLNDAENHVSQDAIRRQVESIYAKILG